MENGGELVLNIHSVTANQLAGNVLEVTIRTSRGAIQGVIHPAQGETGAVVWMGGAGGDMNGPAGGLFSILSHEFVGYGITSFRVRYRKPGNYQECVLDTLASVSFLTGIGATRIALVGHSFGGAIAIAAGALSKAVTAVVGISSQNVGTHLVPNLAPRPLLLIHGSDDIEVTSSASEDIYRRAQEPKQVVLYPGTGHYLTEVRNPLMDLLRSWLNDKVGSRPEFEVSSQPTPRTLVRPIIVDCPDGVLVRDVALFQGDIADVEADAIVCPTNEQLMMGDGVAGRVLAKGGEEIIWEAQQYAPAELSSANMVGGGRLKARHVILTVTGTSAFSYRQPDELSVREATRNCLKRAAERNLKSIAFPALGTGAGGFAYEKAASIMLQEVVEHLKQDACLEKVVFALYNAGAFKAFEEELKQIGSASSS